MSIGRAVAILALPVLAACSERAGVLVITLDAVPPVTRQLSVTLTGAVTRTPTKETEIVVTVAGGAQAVTDTADAGGRFVVVVSLNRNVTNTLQVTAEDAQRNIAEPVTVILQHDNAPPDVASMSPSGDGAAPLASVEVQFTEPVVLSVGGGLRVTHQGMLEPGVTALSADSTRLTFLPEFPLWENAIYQVTIEGVEDPAGNPAESEADLCFVTTAPTAEFLTADDPADDTWFSGTPPASQADLLETRLAAHSGGLFAVYRYTTRRGWGDADPANAWSYLELDIDQNPGTGVASLKDAIFDDFPEMASGITVEYLVALDWFPEVADSALVGRYTEQFAFDVLYALWPDQCGAFQGFSLPSNLFGGDDGNFDFTVVAGTYNGTAGVSVDPAPDTGHLSASFSGSFAASARAARAPAAERPKLVVRVRRP